MSKRINLTQNDNNEINFKSYRINPHQRHNPFTSTNDSDLNIANEMDASSEILHVETPPYIANPNSFIPSENFVNESLSNSCMSSDSFYTKTVNPEM